MLHRIKTGSIEKAERIQDANRKDGASKGGNGTEWSGYNVRVGMHGDLRTTEEERMVYSRLIR